jgi:hypothetical protein
MEQAFDITRKAVVSYVGHIVPMVKEFVDTVKDNSEWKGVLDGVAPVKTFKAYSFWEHGTETFNKAHVSLLEGALSLSLMPHHIDLVCVKYKPSTSSPNIEINMTVGPSYMEHHYSAPKDEFVIPKPVVAVAEPAVAPERKPVRTRGKGIYKPHVRKSRPVEGTFTGWYENVEDFANALIKKTIAPAKMDIVKNIIMDHIDENTVYYERTDKDQYYELTWKVVGEVQSKTVKIYGKEVEKHLYNVNYKRDVSDEAFVDVIEEDE